MTDKLRRAKTGEFGKITDEVRLVEESEVYSEVAPFRRRNPLHVGHDPLLAPHPAKQLRRETDPFLEHLDEPALAEADTLSDFMHPPRAGSAERVDSEPHHLAVRRGVGQP